MARYIVTGATGFIGQALVAALAEAGHDVIVASRTKPAQDVLEHLEFDLRDPSTCKNLLAAEADGVFHLAWSSTPAIAEDDAAGDIATNVAGSVALMEQIARNPATRMVIVSSGGTVYGNAPVVPTPESTPLDPIGAYGLGKATVEHYAAHFWRRGCDIRVARVSNPYGFGQSTARQQGVVPIFARRIIKGMPITIWGSGDALRDYVRVEDVATALLAVMETPFAGATEQPVFNVGAGLGLSLKNLIALIEGQCGRAADIHLAPARPFDLEASVLDIGRIRKSIGWEPAMCPRDGVTKFVRLLVDSRD